MGIKTYNPYTPSRRQMTGSDFSEITKTTPEKSLLDSKKRQAGRNAQGKITVRHRGGGAKKKYRIVDFKRKKDGIPATVVGIEYDPNRSANIALICYADGEKAYILAPEGLKDGMTVMNGPEAEVQSRKLPAAFRDSGWYTGTQHRALSWKRRTACTFRRKQRTAHGERRQIRNTETSVR